jgi:hypothetical protein
VFDAFAARANPIESKPKYMGCRTYLYIPRAIRGDPALGMGEMRSDGRSAKNAKVNVANPKTINNVVAG